MYSTAAAHYALIDDRIIRLDEICAVSPMSEDDNSSLVTFRNGQSIEIVATREEIFNLIAKKS
jgi:hypothetical protein